MWICAGTPCGHDAAELRGWEAPAEQQRSLRTWFRLGEHLRRQHSEREPAVDDAVGQAVGSGATTLADRFEADLPGVADALVDVGERVAVVEIRRVHDVPGGAEPLGKGEDSRRQPLRMMKEENLGHVGRQRNVSSAPGRNRTCDLALRRRALYPLSYGRGESLV